MVKLVNLAGARKDGARPPPVASGRLAEEPRVKVGQLRLPAARRRIDLPIDERLT